MAANCCCSLQCIHPSHLVQQPSLQNRYQSAYSGVVSLVSSSTVKSGSYSISFPSPFGGGTPSFVIGASKMQAPACDIVEWYMSKTALNSAGFSVSYSVGASTTINLMSMYYLGINPSQSALGTFCGASFTNYANSKD